MTAALSVPTAAGPLYDVDTRLRPEGAKGMLVVSLDAFERYQREEAWTWEHMALCRARPVFGSAAARERDRGDHRCDPAHAARRREKVVRDAAKMRAEMERHKPPQSALDVKLGPGGLVDLEFAVHVLQLTRHVGLDPRLDVAIEALIGAEVWFDAKIARSAKVADANAGHDAPRRARRGQADRRRPGSWSPRPAAQPSWDELLAEHDAARQSIAELWNCNQERGVTMINEGDKAPAITATASDGSSVDLGVAGPAAGALFLSQGRHVRAAPARRRISPRLPPTSRRPASRSSASRATR